jgi:hypothetical protein
MLTPMISVKNGSFLSNWVVLEGGQTLVIVLPPFLTDAVLVEACKLRLQFRIFCFPRNLECKKTVTEIALREVVGLKGCVHRIPVDEVPGNLVAWDQELIDFEVPAPATIPERGPFSH